MDKCPECAEHPDCFACIGGKCTALSECGGQGCVFYKPEHQALQEVQRAYQVLKENPELFGEVYIESMENK